MELLKEAIDMMPDVAMQGAEMMRSRGGQKGKMAPSHHGMMGQGQE